MMLIEDARSSASRTCNLFEEVLVDVVSWTVRLNIGGGGRSKPYVFNRAAR